MRQQMFLIASNSEAFPVGSWVWAEEAYNHMTTLAGYDVETITYSTECVDVRTAFGYQFSVSTYHYDRLISA
jgi:hypothetical protein